MTDPVARPAPVVPKLWPGATVVCIGTGPSLTKADVELCRGQRIIAINDAFKLAPWADVLYACDNKWWLWHKGVPSFTGLKYSLDKRSSHWRGVTVLRNTGASGLEQDPTGLRTGYTSGYQAMNLALHLGAAKIVLLGYDFRGDHYFGSHPDHTHPPFAACLQQFARLAPLMAAAGVEVINCTRRTELRSFPCRRLEDALPARLVTQDDVAAGQASAARQVEARP